MTSRKTTLATLAIAALATLGALAPAASATSAPAWELSLTANPTNLPPGVTAGSGGLPKYVLLATNVGGGATSGPLTLTVQLPSGLSPAAGASPSGYDESHGSGVGTTCSVAAQTLTCTDVNPVDPGGWVTMDAPIDVANLLDPSVRNVLATISGGGASPATAQTQTTISDTPAPFGFLPGFEGLNASAVGPDGAPASQAGSHPQGLNVNVALPSVPIDDSRPITSLLPDGTLQDAKVDLPAGMVVDPSATPKCTEAQFQLGQCPDSDQVGSAAIVAAGLSPTALPLYNLEPPPGHAADFAFNIANVPVHVLGGVRPGDYRITSLSPDAISILAVLAARVQLWGSPSDSSHDAIRGDCGGFFAPVGATCPVTPTSKPLISMPTSCTDSMRIDGHVSMWEQLGSFFDRDTTLTDANGNPTAVTGCNQLKFAPTLRARPTANSADSPSGLDVDLGVPQTDSVNQLATAHLRKAVVTLPQGMALNPSSANGLGSCDSDQVGIDPNTGVPNGDPVQCPDASRIGTVEVDTPLLDNPLPGSVYVATPFDNPFDSLLAIYVVVDDPQSGTLIKLSGHVVPDPQTGQLVTTFDNNPQLPFSDFKLTFKGGPHGILRTPATCGAYSTTSQMTPWSAPDSGPAATPHDDYSISQGPNGACAASPDQQPNAPSFDAGTVSPIAGAYSPLVMHLSRNDGDQQFASLTLSTPPGLLGKLAGTPACSDAALDAAASKSGGEEKLNPSCPADSKLGTVTVGAGAGPSPYYTQGTAYLAGPYKGAPLSIAIVTPAAAGPYDLGTVVVRSAVTLDPTTAQITATSDPIPQILQGIPLDVRSVVLNLDKPNFTLNGTSCDESSVAGSLLSSLGQSAPLSQRFQLAECANLGFKPKVSIGLKGGTTRNGHPAATIVVRPRNGDANLSRVQIVMPKQIQLDQSHIQAPCTRPQFAVDACPPQSVIGSVTATSPLVDYPVTGPVYLRTGDNPLPDVVLDLHGPASQPVHFVVVNKVDTQNARLRATAETVPDAPITRAVVHLLGGSKGLLVNNSSLCAQKDIAAMQIDGQNGKTADSTPKVGVKCPKARKHKHHKRAHKRHHRRHHARHAGR